MDSAHLFTDASPVTGTELQGMVLEIFLISGMLVKLVMPGVVLHFGGTRLIDKIIAFLWSLTLMVGTDYKLCKFLLSKIRSVTSDMGTEYRFPECPDILQAFLRRKIGIPFALLYGTIDPESRLLPLALRISGWSHMMGNAMKFAAFSIPKWPEILSNVRPLCRFFRNESWRAHIILRLKVRYPDVVHLLKSFKGKFTKWRYETFFVCFYELAPLRDLCEHFLVDVDQIFASGFQDGSLLKEVKAACRWEELWVFIPVFLMRVLAKLESARRWGLVCACCSELRHTIQRESSALDALYRHAA